MLLNFAYSDQLFVTYPFTASLLRLLALGFGNIPRHPSLLHSILATSAAYFPGSHCQENYEYHNHLALRTLLVKTRRQSAVTEADVFVACMLSWVLYTTGRTNDQCFISATKCCLSLLDYVSGISEGPKSDMFVVFGPFIADSITYCNLLHSGVASFTRTLASVHNSQTSFKKRLRYKEEFIRTCSVKDAWQSASVEATSEIVLRLLQMSLCCLKELVKSDTAKPDRGTVDYACKWVMQEFTDGDFKQAIEGIRHYLSIPANLPTIEGQLGAYTLLGKECIDLILELLCSPCIMSGIMAVEASSTGSSLILRCFQSQKFRRETFPLQHYKNIPFIHQTILVLGGCVLGNVLDICV